MVANNTSVLRSVLDTLLGPDIYAGSVSPSKLAFRIRLVGGAVRGAQCGPVAAHLEALTPLLGQQFIHHSEKVVRKATAKLMKVG